VCVFTHLVDPFFLSLLHEQGLALRHPDYLNLFQSYTFPGRRTRTTPTKRDEAEEKRRHNEVHDSDDVGHGAPGDGQGR
jgi:hypothetical protein